MKVLIIVLLSWTLYDLKNSIEVNHIPTIFMNGLVSLIIFAIFINGMLKASIIPDNNLNQKKFTHTFDAKGTDWDILKNQLYDYYKLDDFTTVAIDKENSWMLQNSTNKNSYIYMSLKDDKINLEVYNTKDFNIKELGI